MTAFILFVVMMIFSGVALLHTNSNLSAQKTATGIITFTTFQITTNPSSEGIETFYASAMKSLPEKTITITIKAKAGYEISNIICQTVSGQTIQLSSLQNDRTTFIMPNSDVIISAFATPNTYTITLDANGGSVTPASIDVIYDSTYGELPIATKTGYTFIGWYTEKNNGTKIESTAKVQILSNITLYAHYTVNQYTITFDGNGATEGTMTNVNTTYDSILQLASNGFAYKSKITLDYGYDIANGELISERPFAGWYSSSAGGQFGSTNTLGNEISTTSTLISDKSYVKNLVPSGDVSLIAQWGEASKQTLPTPTRSKYKFVCWYYLTESGTEMKIYSGSIGTTSDITLYAKWAIVEIETASDLIEFSQTVNGTCTTKGIVNWKYSYENETVTLKTDVSLNNTSNVSNWATSAPANVWTPIGYYNSDDDNTTFLGTFNGNGKTISGIYINTTTLSYQGLFATIGSSAIVKNLTIKNSYIRAVRVAGGIVGYADGATFQNCVNYATISTIGTDDSNDNVGGIVGCLGEESGAVSNCSNYGTITGTKDSVGGIIGKIGGGVVTGCMNAGKISTAGRGCGGIIGFVEISMTMTNCYSTANSDVSATSNAGGVVAYTHGESTEISISSCYNLGKVSTTEGRVGGVVGYLAQSTTVTNCYNAGAVSCEVDGQEGTAGVVGWNYNGVITKCYNKGTITGAVAVGGVAGYSCGTVTECYNEGQVNAASVFGGVVGYLQGDEGDAVVKNCYNTGAVTATSTSSNQMGGVIGYVNVRIEKTLIVSNLYNRGTITGYNYVGGVVGEFYSGSASSNITIRDSYNVGSIIINDSSTSQVFAGGIVGIMWNGSTGVETVENCVSQGTITCSSSIGAIIGCAYNVSTGTITMNKVYLSSSFQYYYPYGTSTGTINTTNLKTGTVSLTTKSTYSSTTYWSSSTSWDFTNTWKISSSINGGYPVFSWQ